MRLALMWSLQAQFAGYVLARERELPELELLERVPGRSPIQELLDGRAELGLVAPVHLLAAGADAEALVLVALFMARSPVRLAGLVERTRGELPLRRARVGIWPGEDTELRAMLRRAGGDRDAPELVPVDDEVRALLDGDVDYVECTTYNELPAIVAAAGGSEAVAVHDPAEWGVDAPKDGIVVRADVLAEQPAMVERFLAAAVAGWAAARADPARAAAAVCRAVPGLRAQEQRVQLERVLELFEPGHPLGEPRERDVARSVHAARTAGARLRGDEVRVDRRPWERAHG